MVDNSSEQKQDTVYKNIHKFSWFPSLLLLFQLFLLLFGLFKFDNEIIEAFNQFLQESSIFLSAVNVLLILWYWKKDTILNRTNTSREFKIVNSCICVSNIVLLNKAYDNKKINVAFNSVKTFFTGKNIAIYVFILVIVVATILIVFYARKVDKSVPHDEISYANSVNNIKLKDNSQSSNSANDNIAIDNAQSQQTSTPETQESLRVKDVSANILFFVIFTVLLLVIVAVLYLIISKYDMVTNIINDTDKGLDILTYLLLAIFVISLIILSIIIVAATARSISKLIFQIPEYIRKAEVSDDRIIKIAVGIVMIPVFYGITKLFGISTDWVLDLLQNQDFLVVPFIILLYFLLSMVFVELLYELLSGKPRKKWVEGFTRIISFTGDSVVKICERIVKTFFRLLNFIPDFLEAIQSVLMGEEDEIDKSDNNN